MELQQLQYIILLFLKIVKAKNQYAVFVVLKNGDIQYLALLKTITMAQQTAVDWLDRWFRDNPEATHKEGNKALEQAKHMEMMQIVKAYHKGLFGNIELKDTVFGDEYYKETYGSNNQI